MTYDWTKLFLFVALAMVVLVLVAPSSLRPLANAPKDADHDASDDASETDPSLITRGPGFANVATNYGPQAPPLMLMMPRQGGAPILDSSGTA